jgi:hypothetical protein
MVRAAHATLCCCYPRVGRGSVVKAAKKSYEPYQWLGIVPLTPVESGQYCSYHPRPSCPPARHGTSARECFRAVFWPRFTPLSRVFVPSLAQNTPRKGSFVHRNGQRTVWGQASLWPGNRACSLDSSVGWTHPCERARLPGAPSARGWPCRPGCGARCGGTLHGGGSAGLHDLAPVRSCPSNPGGPLLLATVGA